MEQAELDTLIRATWDQVPVHGWTRRSITEAVVALGWSPASAGILERGPPQVLEAYVQHCNKQLALRLAEQSGKEGIGSLVRTAPRKERAIYAIRTRIEMMEPFHDTWRQALAIQTYPTNAPQALYQSALMVDEIAHFAGFRDPEFSWYLDRAVLGLTYSATELYWITDSSEGRTETWEFLERGLSRTESVRGTVQDTANNVTNMSDATFSTMSTLLRSMRRS